MFRQPGGFRQRIENLAQKFREKGATSPERAMTVQDLGLPPMFERAMQRRLGQTGIFVQVGDKYYLNEARLAEVEQRRQGQMGGGMRGGMGGIRQNILTIRIIRMIVVVITIALVVYNILTARRADIWEVIVILFVVWIALTIFQIYYLAEARSRRRNQWAPSQ